MSDQPPADEGIWPNDVLARGTMLNGYRIVRLLGRGGFGVTYLAEDVLGQSFALKEYFPRQFAVRHGTQVHAASTEEAQVFDDCRSRFVHEAHALVGLGRSSRMNHDIVRVLTFFEANGTAYMVMEYIIGRTLQAVLRDHPGGMPQEEVRRILCEILAGLAVVHEAGLMHRDIKPANILLRNGVQAVLIDFGSSREARGQQTQGFTQIFSGGYAPPEQILGSRQGPFSDIYAVGVIGYEAIGGKVADALTRQHAVSARTPDPMQPAAHLGARRYDPAFLAVIDAALALDPADRPASADAMARMLREAHGPAQTPAAPSPVPPRPAAPPPAAAPPAPTPVRTARPPRPAPTPLSRRARARRQWLLLAGAGAGALAVGAGAVALWLALDAPPGTPRGTAAVLASQGTAAIPPPPRFSPTPPPPDGLADWRDAAAALPCALLALARDTGDAVLVSGHAAQDAATEAFLARLRDNGQKVRVATEPLDPGLCPALPALADPIRRARDQAPLQLNVVPGAITAGAGFAAMLQGVGGGTLQVDLHAADGTVRHVMRRALPSGQWSIRLQATAAPVPGQQLLVAIATAGPLDLGERPMPQRVDDYFPVLKRELDRAAQNTASPPRADTAVLQALPRR